MYLWSISSNTMGHHNRVDSNTLRVLYVSDLNPGKETVSPERIPVVI